MLVRAQMNAIQLVFSQWLIDMVTEDLLHTVWLQIRELNWGGKEQWRWLDMTLTSDKHLQKSIVSNLFIDVMIFICINK